ncbi:hypothetical protein [Pseudomonas sp. S1(2024)]|uniref:hypothetical protein n=1 Tax=Pseudomonas sp. S1(2024) TaxID=3390191 RepID=UPI00397D40CF
MTQPRTKPGLYARLCAGVAVFVAKQGKAHQAKAFQQRQQAHDFQLARHQQGLASKVFQLPDGKELAGVDLKVLQVTEMTDDDDLPAHEYSLICLHNPSGAYFHLRWHGHTDNFQISACNKFYAEGRIRKAALAIQGIDYRPASECSSHAELNASA